MLDDHPVISFVLIGTGVMLAVIVPLVLFLNALQHIQNGEPCSRFKNWSNKDIPARCVKELTQ